MNDPHDTRNEARLSLAERARLDLLAQEPELLLSELLQLEHGNKTARESLCAEILKAIDYGDLVSPSEQEHICKVADLIPGFIDPIAMWEADPIHCGNYPGWENWVHARDPLIDRESYRVWRARCPASLLCEALTQIKKWLGEPARPAAKPARPEPAASILPESIPPEPAGIALVEAENAALVALRKRLKREPDFDEFWDYLTTKDETGIVADFADDRVDWVGKSGKACSTSKSTFRNRLTAAKKRNPFTPV